MPADADGRARRRRIAGAVHGKVATAFRARPARHTREESDGGLAQPGPTPVPLRTPARLAQPSEPILFPKLRIQFADFPYLHYSIDQRLLTLETCCGYGYEMVGKRRNPTEIFKIPSTTRGCNKKCYTLRQKPKPILSSKEFQGLGGLCRKDNSSQSFDGRLSVCSCCHD